MEKNNDIVANLPSLPGVYLFKGSDDTVLYVGKAKNLKKRVANYFQKQDTDWKAAALVAESSTIEHIVTHSEIEAMLLEAKLIQNYQPKFNVLLKTGQPYLYLAVTQGRLPELKIVRNKTMRGTYFGPFLEKTPARRVYDFLIKTFQLKLCKKKIPQGCLNYHLGICAGSCRDDFDEAGYRHRLELATQALTRGHTKFLAYLQEQIAEHNKKLEFEKSKELHAYYQAFENVFSSLDTHFSAKEKELASKHIWILLPEKEKLFLFIETNSATKKREQFNLSFGEHSTQEFVEGYYQSFDCPNTILTNFELEDLHTLELFLQQWHKKNYPVSIIAQPTSGHMANLISLATTHAYQELEKQGTLATSLKTLLKLPIAPHTIDCFDISHRQGMNMVGSCIRFKDGKPDKNMFRKFKIQTVEGQDDYACLREIVARRYKDQTELPDLILIDGGKGQLHAVQDLFPTANFACLAKREETIFSNNIPAGRKITSANIAGQTLIALRDYAHHFAISYHRKLTEKSLE